MEFEKIYYKQIREWLAKNQNNSIIVIANECKEDGKSEIFTSIEGEQNPLISSLAQHIDKSQSFRQILGDAQYLCSEVRKRSKEKLK
jgi:hypothetical protein|nr:MAG TPA: hypothetical protein [Caudoviricetes sp.]